MREPQFVWMEISFAVQPAATAMELRLHCQLHVITNDVLRLGGLGYVCGIGQGGGRADINADIRQAALEQAWSALHDQFQAAGALDRLTVTAHGLGPARVLWPVPADDRDPPDSSPPDSSPRTAIRDPPTRPPLALEEHQHVRQPTSAAHTDP